MATILPNEIPPLGVWRVDRDGMLPQICWLYIYNLGSKTLGNQGNSAPVIVSQISADIDADIDSTDVLPLTQRVAALENSGWLDPVIAPVVPLFVDDPPVNPVAQAQPVQTITVGASPYTYQALADGSVIINGGTVSAMAVSRDGTTFYTVTANMIPVSRLDRVKITYSAAPTAVFFPR